MGLFSGIGKSFDKAMGEKSEQQKMMEQQMQQQQGGPPMMTMSQPMGNFGNAAPQTQNPLGGILGGVGGASAMHQTQQVSNQGDQMGFLNNMSAFGPLLSSGNNATPQQQKDFRVLEQTLIEACAKQCLKPQRNYHKDSELCQAKCYDVAFVYSRVGINEINQFAYENGIRT